MSRMFSLALHYALVLGLVKQSLFLLLFKKKIRFLFRISVWMLWKQEGEMEKDRKFESCYVILFKWKGFLFWVFNVLIDILPFIFFTVFLWLVCVSFCGVMHWTDFFFLNYSNSYFIKKSLIMCFDAEKIRGEKEKDGFFYLFGYWENKLKRWMFCLMICWLSWALPLSLPSFFYVV